MKRYILIGALGFLVGSIAFQCANDAHAQANVQNNAVPCWPVPNGLNSTTQCANGYWQTITPEGEVFQGNGRSDPSATAQGSTIVIDPRTGGPFVGAGSTVTPPTQVLPMLEPYQAQSYGFQPRQD